ncbi:hypothetical protein ACFPK1_27280 [Actinomycetospora rhizophila]|uniref:Uncharacterized protein n=1 Tax=Actinomycetospora rhizophila TaxID=1416876 RepID=A0ABV9ZNB7_9PSEU
MTQIPGEPLGQMMEALDGTRFSHSGIAVRHPRGDLDLPATHMASALATKLDGEGFDIGGVRWDPFHELWDKHRDLYCIPMPDQLRGRALAYLDVFRPEPGQEGTFSLVKLVAVALALRAIELQEDRSQHAEALFTAASDIATAWAATVDEPSYYCAELVANAYGRTFTRAEMVPPKGTPGLGDGFDEPWWISRLAALLSERFEGIDDPRGRAWAGLTSALAGGDWDFVVHAIGASARSAIFMLRGRIEGDVAVPDELVAPAPGHPGLAQNDAIPPALVTPRMLWAVFGHDAAGNDLIRRIEPPR